MIAQNAVVIRFREDKKSEILRNHYTTMFKRLFVVVVDLRNIQELTQ